MNMLNRGTTRLERMIRRLTTEIERYGVRTTVRRNRKEIPSETAPRTGERGSAMLITLAFIALAVPIASAALGFVSTASIESRANTKTLQDQYSAIGANQDAAYRLAYETGFADGLTPGVPFTYTIDLNGRSVTTTVMKLSATSGEPPPPRSDNSRTFQATKVVYPTSASPGVLTSYAYTITVENRSDRSKQLNKIEDELPPGFSYVSLSSSGVTISDPSIDGQKLRWDIGGLQVDLAPGQSATLTFEAQATLVEGIYCNEAWVSPGGAKTSSGKTARVTVGSPTSNLCSGPAVQVTKTVDTGVALGNGATTFTYTIAIESQGTDVLNMSRIRDLLPPGFTYVAGTTAGDVTTEDPNTTMWQGAERLTWDFNPNLQIQPGESKSLSFETTATVPPGDYLNEVWVSLDEFNNTVYTWPTALVEIMSAQETTAGAGDVVGEGEVWANEGTWITRKWSIRR